jgi:DNA-binding MarR family transcriptional regulator
MEPAEPAAEARDALRTTLLFDVFALNQAVARFLADAMRGSPLTPLEYAISSAIFELECGSPSALASRLGMPLTTLADHLARLETRGHARRLPNPRDRRSQLVTLTAVGLDAHRAANRLFEAAHDAFVRELAEGEAAGKAHLAAVRSAVERASVRSAVSRPSRGRAG